MKHRKITNHELHEMIQNHEQSADHNIQIIALKKRLRELGAVGYDISLPETRSLPLVLFDTEEIIGIVYGRYRREDEVGAGRGLLVATNKRVVLIDKKPLYLRYDEITYENISGIGYTRVGWSGTVVLHAHFGKLQIRTFNHKCATNFVHSVEEVLYSQKVQ